jgi:hypothetical protein
MTKSHLLLLFVILTSTPLHTIAGYSQETLKPLLQIIDNMTYYNQSIKMLELGNQEAHDHYDINYEPFASRGFISMSVVMKYFFQHIGIHHTSIDLNGYDSALPLDCREDLTDLLPEKYDIITNIGFGEHVGEGDKEKNLIRNQYTLFRSIHNIGKVNAIYYHEFIVDWPAHGVCNYDVSFILELCRLCNYEIILGPYEPKRKAWEHLPDNERPKVALVAFRKTTDSPFISFQEFSTIPGLKSNYHTYNIRNFHWNYKDTTYYLNIDISLHSPEVYANSFCTHYAKETEPLEHTICVEKTMMAIQLSSIENSIRS